MDSIPTKAPRVPKETMRPPAKPHRPIRSTVARLPGPARPPASAAAPTVVVVVASSVADRIQ